MNILTLWWRYRLAALRRRAVLPDLIDVPATGYAHDAIRPPKEDGARRYGAYPGETVCIVLGSGKRREAEFTLRLRREDGSTVETMWAQSPGEALRIAAAWAQGRDPFPYRCPASLDATRKAD